MLNSRSIVSIGWKHAGFKIRNTFQNAKIVPFKIIQQNHTIIQVGKSLSPTANPAQPGPPLNHVPKWHINLSFEYLQRWWLQHFPEQPVPICWPHYFPYKAGLHWPSWLFGHMLAHVQLIYLLQSEKKHCYIYKESYEENECSV